MAQTLSKQNKRQAMHKSSKIDEEASNEVTQELMAANHKSSVLLLNSAEPKQLTKRVEDNSPLIDFNRQPKSSKLLKVALSSP